MTFDTGDEYSNGYFQMNPVYDIVIKRIQAAYPGIFDNFTHVPLNCIDNATSGETIVGDEAKDLDLYDGDTVSGCFFNFYYQNLHLFTEDLAQQFTIINTRCK
jgi:hypothetical protein